MARAAVAAGGDRGLISTIALLAALVPGLGASFVGAGCNGSRGGAASGGAAGGVVRAGTGGAAGVTGGLGSGGFPSGAAGTAASGGGAGGTPGAAGHASGGTPATGGSGGAGGGAGMTPGTGGGRGDAGAGVAGAGGGGMAGTTAAWMPTRCNADPPSCVGLPHTCGPNGDGDCCESELVPTGTFQRDNYDFPEYQATVDTFCLDKYEITLGRFRQFVAGYPANVPAAGAGKNPNNPTDPGWDPAWIASLPATQANLMNALADYTCSPLRVWSATPAGQYESMPMNCASWFMFYAFCIWDGGWLPTRVEWDYAARGGAQQRVYPWSTPPSDTTLDGTYATYGCHDTPDQAAACNPVIDIFPVGVKPKGDGLFGQSDLIGNVMEWVQDWHVQMPQTPCDDCADLTSGMYRDLRGGSAVSYAQNLASTADATYYIPTQTWGYIGARCARMP